MSFYFLELKYNKLNFKNMLHEFPPKAVKKAIPAGELFSNKEQERKKEVEKARKQRSEDWRLQQLTDEASSFTSQDKRQTVEHVSGRKTRVGDQLQRGPRGGRFSGGKGLERLR